MTCSKIGGSPPYRHEENGTISSRNRLLRRGLALGVKLLRMPHSPAVATDVLVAMSAAPGVATFLALLLLNTVILVAADAMSAKLDRHMYPVYWC